MDWNIIIPFVLTALLLLSGGYIKRVLNETKELLAAISAAIEDDNIDNAELTTIIKEGKDVKTVLHEIIKLVK